MASVSVRRKELPFPLVGKGEGWGASDRVSVGSKKPMAFAGQHDPDIDRLGFPPLTPTSSPQGGGEQRGAPC